MAAAVLILLLSSIYSIGPTQIGLVRKRFGAKLPGDNPLACRGEAGYQSEMLMPGLRFKLYLVFAVTKHPLRTAGCSAGTERHGAGKRR